MWKCFEHPKKYTHPSFSWEILECILKKWKSIWYQKKKNPLKKASELQLVNPEVCKEVTADWKGTSCAPTLHRASPLPPQASIFTLPEHGCCGEAPWACLTEGNRGSHQHTSWGLSERCPLVGIPQPRAEACCNCPLTAGLVLAGRALQRELLCSEHYSFLVRKGTWLLHVSSTYWMLLNLAHLLRCSLLPLCHCSWEFMSLSKLTFLFQVGPEGPNLHVWF